MWLNEIYVLYQDKANTDPKLFSGLAWDYDSNIGSWHMYYRVSCKNGAQTQMSNTIYEWQQWLFQSLVKNQWVEFWNIIPMQERIFNLR
jgi:hypothetical protein